MVSCYSLGIFSFRWGFALAVPTKLGQEFWVGRAEEKDEQEFW